MFTNHAGEVMVLDVIENGMASGQSAQQIAETSLGQAPWNVATHPVVYVDPGTQPSSDYSSAATFYGYPTVPLIDLQTMEVIVADCWDYPTPGAMDWEACVSDNL